MGPEFQKPLTIEGMTGKFLRQDQSSWTYEFTSSDNLPVIVVLPKEDISEATPVKIKLISFTHQKEETFGDNELLKTAIICICKNSKSEGGGTYNFIENSLRYEDDRKRLSYHFASIKSWDKSKTYQFSIPKNFCSILTTEVQSVLAVEVDLLEQTRENLTVILQSLTSAGTDKNEIKMALNLSETTTLSQTALSLITAHRHKDMLTIGRSLIDQILAQ